MQSYKKKKKLPFVSNYYDSQRLGTHENPKICKGITRYCIEMRVLLISHLSLQLCSFNSNELDKDFKIPNNYKICTLSSRRMKLCELFVTSVNCLNYLLQKALDCNIKRI